MKKVVAYLQGGLGNQCFVYATARALAIDANALLEYDGRLFCMDKVFRRVLELDSFECKLGQVKVPGWLHRKLWNLCRLKFKTMLGRGYYDEVSRRFVKIDTDFVGTLKLDGYWQSEKYFYDHRDAILQDFRLKDTSWLAHDCIAAQIVAQEESCFCHVRSYKDIPGMKDGQDVDKMARYYRSAAEYVRKHITLGKVFVFSDDLGYARNVLEEAFAGLLVVYVDSSTKPDGVSGLLHDFTLMRMCKHGIVANSSFSWWAGWLGEQERLAKGEQPLRVRPNERCNNDDFWPERWVAI